MASCLVFRYLKYSGIEIYPEQKLKYKGKVHRTATSDIKYSVSQGTVFWDSKF